MDVSVSSAPITLEPQRGAAVTLETGDVLFIGTTEGAQVADLAFFAQADPRDSFSPGRTMDYNERLVPQVGDCLYSHRSTPLATIVRDDTAVHDLLLSPCSEVMFARRGEFDHRSCHSNLSHALRSFGLGPDDVRTTLNVFMDVRIEGNRIALYPPPNGPQDLFAVRAELPIIVAISSCSSELTNAGRCKPVRYWVEREAPQYQDLNRH